MADGVAACVSVAVGMLSVLDAVGSAVLVGDASAGDPVAPGADPFSASTSPQSTGAARAVWMNATSSGTQKTIEEPVRE